MTSKISFQSRFIIYNAKWVSKGARWSWQVWSCTQFYLSKTTQAEYHSIFFIGCPLEYQHYPNHHHQSSQPVCLDGNLSFKFSNLFNFSPTEITKFKPVRNWRLSAHTFSSELIVYLPIPKPYFGNGTFLKPRFRASCRQSHIIYLV